MFKFIEINDLRNKSIEELQLLKDNIYNNFVDALSKVPLDVRETFNYYINLARNIDIIINEKIEQLSNENMLKK